MRHFLLQNTLPRPPLPPPSHLFSSLPSTCLLQPQSFNLFISFSLRGKKQNQYRSRAARHSTKPLPALSEPMGWKGTQWAQWGTQNLSCVCFEVLRPFWLFTARGNSKAPRALCKQLQRQARGEGCSGEGWRCWTDLQRSWAYKCLQGSVPIPISMFCCALGGRLVPTLLLQHEKKDVFHPGTWGHDCPSPSPAAICGRTTATTCPKYRHQRSHKYPKSHQQLPASSFFSPPNRETCASFPEGAYTCCDSSI